MLAEVHKCRKCTTTSSLNPGTARSRRSDSIPGACVCSDVIEIGHQFRMCGYWSVQHEVR